jgi:hypothetical protein
MTFVDESKAYVLGLMTAGGTLTPTSFFIEMPFDQWGTDAATMTEVSRNLLTKTQKQFWDAYGIRCDFGISSKNCWRIKPLSFDSERHSSISDAVDAIRQDLNEIGLPTSGFLLDTADLVQCRKLFTKPAGKRFLAGIFDARASLTRSQRRFSDGNPMVSIEVPGSTMNFKFVVQLCAWMTSLGSVTDQINFNHPSIHASDDPTYESWRKGFKIRLTGKSFFENHSFGIAPKSFDVKSLADLQKSKVQKPCTERTFRSGDRSLHKDLEASDLPVEVRGKAFLHYLHICAEMGCPYAPSNEIKVAVAGFNRHIAALPICTKGSFEKIDALFNQIRSTKFPDSVVVESVFPISDVIGRVSRIQYPEIEGALKYLAADEVFGNRYKGNGAKILEDQSGMEIQVIALQSTQIMDFPPIVLHRPSQNRAVLISSIVSELNNSMLDDLVEVTQVTIRVKHDALKSIYG